MRRIVIAVTALVVLGTASAVYAATTNPINKYTAPMKFTPGKAGSKKKPSPIGFTQDITAAGTNGNRTAVTLDFLTKIYGLKVDGKDFPTCSLHKIATAKNDSGCPKGAKVASGFITAALGSFNNFSTTAPGVQACDPKLDVWNGGQGKLTFFFVTDSDARVPRRGPNDRWHAAVPRDVQESGRLPGDQRPDSGRDRLPPRSRGPGGITRDRAPGLGQEDQEGEGKDGRLDRVRRLQGRQAAVLDHNHGESAPTNVTQSTTVSGSAKCSK